MAVYSYDVVVLGSGPAGEGAAMNAAKNGRRVAVVDNRQVVGGNCTHLGTIPSKALRHSVKQIIQFNTNEMFRSIGEPRWFSFPDVLRSAERVIARQVSSRTSYYARNRVDLFFGTASFADENTIEIVNLRVRSGAPGGQAGRHRHRLATLSPGGRGLQPSAHLRQRHHPVADPYPAPADHLWRRGDRQRYASIFSGLGVLVDLIDNRDQLLSFLDDEISDALSYHLQNNNVLIRHNEEYERIEGQENGVVLHLKSGKKLRADALLWCNGRTGNTDQLGLQNVGISVNSRGQVTVDENYRTSVANIYAAGDVIGWPSLASAAYDQGRSASDNILHDNNGRVVNDIPTGIYTIPEISSLGKTERELTQERCPTRSARPSSRAWRGRRSPANRWAC